MKSRIVSVVCLVSIYLCSKKRELDNEGNPIKGETRNGWDGTALKSVSDIFNKSHLLIIIGRFNGHLHKAHKSKIIHNFHINKEYLQYSRN